LPSFLKALLVVVAVVLVFGGILGLAGWYWWSRHGNELTRSAVSTQQEGMEAGKSLDQQGCLDESFARIRKDPGFEPSVKARLFLTGCLVNAKKTPGFCDGIPPADQFVESVKWRIGVCEAHKDVDPNECQALFAMVQAHCAIEGKKEHK
jgi:hypothetical protein